MEQFCIGNAPVTVWGGEAHKAFIFVHGLGGSRAEAACFAEVVRPFGYAVLGVDLPEHGGRTDGARLVPWEAIPELEAVMRYARGRWQSISVRAISIGAWLALQAFDGEAVDVCLLSSPLLDMEAMILSMMQAAGASEAQLRAAGELPTEQGQTLSWRYLCHARERRVHPIGLRTHILYATGDELIPRETVERFAADSSVRLTLYEGGRHWLHTDEQLQAMRDWERDAVKCQ